MTVRRARAVIIAAIAKKAEKAKSKTYTERQSRSSAFQTVDKPLYFLKMGSQGLPPPTGSRGGR